MDRPVEHGPQHPACRGYERPIKPEYEPYHRAADDSQDHCHSSAARSKPERCATDAAQKTDKDVYRAKDDTNHLHHRSEADDDTGHTVSGLVSCHDVLAAEIPGWR